jgi:hypothetical protein
MVLAEVARYLSSSNSGQSGPAHISDGRHNSEEVSEDEMGSAMDLEASRPPYIHVIMPCPPLRTNGLLTVETGHACGRVRRHNRRYAHALNRHGQD